MLTLALGALKDQQAERGKLILIDAWKAGPPQPAQAPYLARVGLDQPETFQDKVTARLLAAAMRDVTA